jgi:hypothetical protein
MGLMEQRNGSLVEEVGEIMLCTGVELGRWGRMNT